MDFHTRLWSKIDVAQCWECWDWKANTCKGGYGRISIGGKGKQAHRVVWEVINGPIPSGMCICHHCDNPSCCNPNHLFIGTHRDNARDRDKKGRGVGGWVNGEGHTNAKLTWTDVGLIRHLFDNGVNRTTIADVFGVSRRNIDLIGSRRTWKHITTSFAGNGDKTYD